MWTLPERLGQIRDSAPRVHTCVWNPALLHCRGWGRGVCVCVCRVCRDHSGDHRNVSKSDGTVNSHLSPGRVLDDLPILVTSQAAFFCLGPPQIGVICSLSFLFPANLVKLGSRNPFKRMHFPPCLSCLRRRAESGPVQPVAPVNLPSFEGKVEAWQPH